MLEVPDLLSNAVKRFPDTPCVIEGDRTLTFREVDERADRVAVALKEQGIGKGQRVALLALNELEYLEIHLGVSRAGAVLVPLNYRFAVPELSFIMKDSQPDLLIHGPGFEGAAARLECERVWHFGGEGVGQAYEDVLARTEPERALRLQDASAANSILYTSGTTGRPKGAIISHGALWARLNMFGLEAGMAHGDVFVQGLPMFHIAAHLAYAFTYRGVPLVLIKTFDPALVLAEIARHQGTHVLLVPTMINMVANDESLPEHDLSSLQMVLYGASPISPGVLRRAMSALKCDFLQFFGMTETAGSTLLRTHDHDPDGRPELLPSAGTDALSMETRIVDLDDRDVPPGEVGEILTRGPCVMDGYWNSPGATAEALRGGWMHTGDMGYRSEEGYLFVTDRLKDMVISGGENVYPREVEDALYEHPAVLEAAVIGIPHEEWGEAVHALVVPRPGEQVDKDDLLRHCRERLAGYKVPKSVQFVDELPKNATGKVLKRVLREQQWKEADRRVG
jgi:acyl-CoA synthetase (AMP-forming)/AMP-acid ligase II